MSEDTLMSAARAAGFAMAPSDDIRTLAKRGSAKKQARKPEPPSDAERVEMAADELFAKSWWWPFSKAA